MSASHVRYVSAKLLGNEKTVEVVRALGATSGVATAAQLAEQTGIGHSLVRDVLVRLVEADVLSLIPRAHARAPLYYEVRPGDMWRSLQQLADAIVAHVEERDQGPRSTADTDVRS